jgi:acyl-CoA synthetase (AMP-forming)/AMP-acid ligase II
MKMRQGEPGSLLDWLPTPPDRSDRFLWGAKASAALRELLCASSLAGTLSELRGRSVLLAAKDQLAAALALIELDGIARRIVVCPPDLLDEHVLSVIETAQCDAIVSDQTASGPGHSQVASFVTCAPVILPAAPQRRGCDQTEWILLTSGTTGLPKLVVHSLASLTAPIKAGKPTQNPAVWSTFYDIRRYGGLQIFLRAVIGGGSLVLSSAGEATGDFLIRAAAHSVTHISGTPSHWRRALMSPLARHISPQYVRLSGEIPDQAILDHLRTVYPEAQIAHAFASTEAGVAFEVGDGLSGFPASLIRGPGAEVEMKVQDGSLRIRSARTAIRYLGREGKPLADEDGFVDTGDVVELKGCRYYFVGRRDGIINVGGRKVHPEEVEAVINRHPKVQMSLVKARRNPITGAVVTADIVLRGDPRTATVGAEAEPIKAEILESCRRALAPHKVPAAIRFVSSLDVAASGKLARLGS